MNDSFLNIFSFLFGIFAFNACNTDPGLKVNQGCCAYGLYLNPDIKAPCAFTVLIISTNITNLTNCTSFSVDGSMTSY